MKTFGEALLDADTDRTIGVEVLAVDEALFVRRGPRHHTSWATSVVHVVGPPRAPKPIEVIEDRTAKVVSAWIDDHRTWSCRTDMIAAHKMVGFTAVLADLLRAGFAP